jgi:hypothetical protein
LNACSAALYVPWIAAVNMKREGEFLKAPISPHLRSVMSSLLRLVAGTAVTISQDSENEIHQLNTIYYIEMTWRNVGRS